MQHPFFEDVNWKDLRYSQYLRRKSVTRELTKTQDQYRLIFIYHSLHIQLQLTLLSRLRDPWRLRTHLARSHFLPSFSHPRFLLWQLQRIPRHHLLILRAQYYVRIQRRRSSASHGAQSWMPSMMLRKINHIPLLALVWKRPNPFLDCLLLRHHLTSSKPAECRQRRFRGTRLPPPFVQVCTLLTEHCRVRARCEGQRQGVLYQIARRCSSS